MLFRRVLMPAIICITLISTAVVPATAAVAGPAGTADDSSSAGMEVRLSEEATSGVWQADLTTQDGVNIVGLTWEQGEESAANSGSDEAQSVDHGELPTVRLRSRIPGEAWGSWRDMVISRTETSTGTDGDLIVGEVELQLELDAGSLDEGSADLVLDPIATVWNESARPADTDAALDLRADGSSLSKSGQTTHTPGEAATSDTGLNIATRGQWGADESLRKWSPNYIDGNAGVTIHHTAGTNSYSAAQVPAILRGVYRYHAVTRDWGDVGYNVFVDKYGRAWEGRRGGPEKALRTAHALGMNYTTAGIALVGDYTSTNVPSTAFDTLARVTAWKLDAQGNSATGTFRHENTYESWTRDLPRVHGHRDVNGTSCPGARFYSRIGEFRSLVRQYQGDSTAVQRVAGPNRYATAAQLARDAHPFGVDTAYITGGSALIESLVVGAAAAHFDDALLLTRSSSLPDETRSELQALTPKRVVVVGDEAQVSPTVLSQIRSAVKVPVSRLTSSEQYDLAAQLAQGWQQADAVYVSSGVEPADALSGGAAAAADDAPLLLSADADGLPASTREALIRLQPKTVYLLGGTARLPSSTAQEIRQALPNSTVTRLSGSDRYATSAAVVNHRFDISPRVLTANGRASIDAIAGTQYADASDSAVLLTRRSCSPRLVRSAMNGVDADLVVLLGGTSRLTERSGTTTC
ncbi:hypothetical protein BH23ACT6_BH23ACT6_15540 [soil metagenome]